MGLPLFSAYVIFKSSAVTKISPVSVCMSVPAFRYEMHTVTVRHSDDADTINTGGVGQTFSSKGISQGPALDCLAELELCSLDTAGLPVS